MTKLKNEKFWTATLKRAGRSAAQGLITGAGLDIAADLATPIWQLAWWPAIGGAATMFVLSILNSIIATPPEVKVKK